MSRQEHTISVKTNVDETYTGLKNAIEKLRYSVEQYDDSAHTAYIKTGIGAFSWGEKITVEVTPDVNGGSVVALSSAPKLGTNMVDMGRGKRELTAIANALAAELGEAPKAPQAEPSATPKTVSVADEIRQFAALKEQGILTEEEFSAKKKQLLGL